MKSVEIYSVLYSGLSCGISREKEKKKKKILQLINKSYQLKGNMQGRAR